MSVKSYFILLRLVIREVVSSKYLYMYLGSFRLPDRDSCTGLWKMIRKDIAFIRSFSRS